MAAREAPLRVVVYTPIWPNRCEPLLGPYNVLQLRALLARYRAAAPAVALSLPHLVSLARSLVPARCAHRTAAPAGGARVAARARGHRRHPDPVRAAALRPEDRPSGRGAARAGVHAAVPAERARSRRAARHVGVSARLCDGAARALARQALGREGPRLRHQRRRAARLRARADAPE